MNKSTLHTENGSVKSFEVLTGATIIRDKADGTYSSMRMPAILAVNQFEVRPDEPTLSIGLGDRTIILEFNSDFPLLFEEGIKLWK